MRVNLKAALLRCRIRQYEAANKLGITDTRLSRIVCGRLEPTDEEKRKLASLVREPIEKLFDV